MNITYKYQTKHICRKCNRESLHSNSALPPSGWKVFVLHLHHMWTTCNPEGDDHELNEHERQVFIARLGSIGKYLI